MKRILSLVLVSAMMAVMVLSLASCSVYGTIEKNFTSNGYEVVEADSTLGKAAALMSGSLASEDGEVSITTHILYKQESMPPAFAIILEFGADKDAQEKIAEYTSKATLDKYMQFDEEVALVRGNCIIIPLSASSADRLEMVNLFNK